LLCSIRNQRFIVGNYFFEDNVLPSIFKQFNYGVAANITYLFFTLLYERVA